MLYWCVFMFHCRKQDEDVQEMWDTTQGKRTGREWTGDGKQNVAAGMGPGGVVDVPFQKSVLPSHYYNCIHNEFKALNTCWGRCRVWAWDPRLVVPWAGLAEVENR